MARRRRADVQLFTRNGFNWTARFSKIERAVAALRCSSCLIDGEVVSCDENGVPNFEALRRRGPALLYVFDLLELDGKRPALRAHRGPQGGAGEVDLPACEAANVNRTPDHPLQ